MNPKLKPMSEIVDAISAQLEEVANSIDFDALGVDDGSEYKIIVCPERIFVDDYLPSEEQWVAKNTEIPSLDWDSPTDSPYRNTLFFIIHVGSGDRNMAVSATDITIQAISEENDFVVARQILDEFVVKYNFKYDAESGIVQAYFNPEMTSSEDEVYTGFRALLSCRGFVRIPTDGVLFVENINFHFSYNDTDISVNVPFINLNYNLTSQPDPQAFAGFYGETTALNKQTTEGISFSTYLVYYANPTGDEVNYNAFSRAVMGMKKNMNRKFHIRMETQVYEDPTANPKVKICIADDWYILTGVTYNQELGDISAWGLSFTKAKEVEE